MKEYTIIRIRSKTDIEMIYRYALTNNLFYNNEIIDPYFKALMERETEIILIGGKDFWTIDLALEDGYRQEKMNLNNFQVINAIDLLIPIYKEV